MRLSIVFRLRICFARVVAAFASDLSHGFLRCRITIGGFFRDLSDDVCQSVSANDDFGILSYGVRSWAYRQAGTRSTYCLRMVRFCVIVGASVYAYRCRGVVVHSVFLLVDRFWRVLVCLVRFILFRFSSRGVGAVFWHDASTADDRGGDVVVGTRVLQIGGFMYLCIFWGAVLVSAK